MWFQTTMGTFAIARFLGDVEHGLVHWLGNSYDDLLLFADRYVAGCEPMPIKHQTFAFAIRLPESRAIQLMGQLVSEVWYSDMPQAIDTLYGPRCAQPYQKSSGWISELRLTHQDIDKQMTVKARTVLMAGIEGGAVSVAVQEEDGFRRYTVSLHDETADFLKDEDAVDLKVIDRTEVFYSWDEALAHLSQIPWWQFYPLKLDPEYRELVRLAFRQRGLDLTHSNWGSWLNDSPE